MFFTRKKADGQADAGTASTAAIAQPISVATTAAYHHGSVGTRVAYLLSAPGRHEQAAGAPLSGKTGRNVESVTVFLNQARPSDFPATTRTQVRLLQSDEKVHYKSLDGRSEGKSAENLSAPNKARIRNQLTGIDTVVAFGAKANEVIREVGFEGKVISAPHPSMQNMNRTINSDKDTKQARAADRLSQLTKGIVEQI